VKPKDLKENFDSDIQFTPLGRIHTHMRYPKSLLTLNPIVHVGSEMFVAHRSISKIFSDIETFTSNSGSVKTSRCTQLKIENTSPNNTDSRINL
jgi:hypothetical protein